MKFLDLVTFVPVNEWLASMECGGHVIIGHIEAYSCKKTSSDRKLYKSLQMSGSFNTSGEVAVATTSSSGLLIPTPVSVPIAVPAASVGGASPQNSSPQGLSAPVPIQKAGEGSGSGSGSGSPLSPVFSSGSLVGGSVASDENNTFVHLIATLNAAMPDYDFTCAKSEHFTRVTVYELMNHVKTALEGAEHLDRPVPLADLWSALEQEVQLQQCEAFTYQPPPDSDPFLEDDVIWAMNYFMYNRNIKRIVFLTLSCQRPGSMAPISPSTTPSLPASIASRPGLPDSPTPAMDDQPFGFRGINIDNDDDDDDDDDMMD